MDKKRLFRIMTKADSQTVAALSGKLTDKYPVVIMKEPGKTLTMIRLREPVKQSVFYLGEVMVCEAMVEIGGVKGTAVTMGDNYEKTLHMAIIDAACNKGVFEDEGVLLRLEQEQRLQEEKENTLHLNTMVNFTSMDQEGV